MANGGHNGHDGLNDSSIFFMWGWGENFKKNPKNYIIIKIPKNNIFYKNLVWDYVCLLALYGNILLCLFFFLKGASRQIHSGKFIIQCPCCYICCVCEEERRERNIENPKKNYKTPKEYYFFVLNYLFSINVLSSANGDLYPVLTVIYIQC